ncbi:hypothetical protein ACDF64_10445 [Agromyces sp. MMS24-JH15]|uniref:hypothetical protein n=1 Tax=Agromyces sp. MMS24-JH15 TaxID=3243765 RepID=UPI003749FFB3
MPCLSSGARATCARCSGRYAVTTRDPTAGDLGASMLADMTDDPWRRWLAPSSPLDTVLRESARQQDRNADRLVDSVDRGAAQLRDAAEQQRMAQEVMASVVVASNERTNQALASILDVLASPAETIAREHIRRGVHAFRQGWDDDALDELTKAVEADRYIGIAHLYLGLVMERLGMTEEAQEQYRLTVKYGRGDAPVVASGALRLLAIAEQLDDRLLESLLAELHRCPEFLIAAGARTGDARYIAAAIDLAPELGIDAQVLGVVDVPALLAEASTPDSLVRVADDLNDALTALGGDGAGIPATPLADGAGLPERLLHASDLATSSSAILLELRRRRARAESWANHQAAKLEEYRAACDERDRLTESLEVIDRELHELTTVGRPVTSEYRASVIAAIGMVTQLFYDERSRSVSTSSERFGEVIRRMTSIPDSLEIQIAPPYGFRSDPLRDNGPFNMSDSREDDAHSRNRAEQQRAELLGLLRPTTVEGLEAHVGAVLAAEDHASFQRRAFDGGWSLGESVSTSKLAPSAHASLRRLIVLRDTLYGRSEEIDELLRAHSTAVNRLTTERSGVEHRLAAASRAVDAYRSEQEAGTTAASVLDERTMATLTRAIELAETMAVVASSRIRPFVA